MADYKKFGVMIDCSRNAVMLPSQVKKFTEYIKKIGYDTLLLYMEDTYAIDGEPYFGYMRGRYTAEELRDIDIYAKNKGVEVIPCIQTLAHFHTLVRHDTYKDIVDTADVLLAGEEKTYTLIERMFETISKTFSSKNVHIGMDEAKFLGTGKYLQKNGYVKPFEILKEHLRKVVEIAKKYGLKPIIWSDMLFYESNNGCYYGKDIQIPSNVSECLPKDVQLAYWDYYHYKKEEYDGMIKSHELLNRPLWFCGAVWTWCGFVPLWEKTLRTMKEAMQSVRERGVNQVMITMWGDGGKECSYFSALPLLYAVRQYADGNFDENAIRDGFFQTTGLQFNDFQLISKINGCDCLQNLYTCSMHLYNDCLLGFNDCFVEENGEIPYNEYKEEIREIKRRVREFAYIFDTIEKLCNVLQIKYDFGVRLRKAYRQNDKKELKKIYNECDLLIRRINVFYQSFKRLWHIENKAFGFEVQTLRIGALIQRIKDCKQLLKDYFSKKITAISQLEETPLRRGVYDAQYLSLFSAGRNE